MGNVFSYCLISWIGHFQLKRHSKQLKFFYVLFGFLKNFTFYFFYFYLNIDATALDNFSSLVPIKTADESVCLLWFKFKCSVIQNLLYIKVWFKSKFMLFIFLLPQNFCKKIFLASFYFLLNWFICANAPLKKKQIT